MVTISWTREEVNLVLWRMLSNGPHSFPNTSGILSCCELISSNMRKSKSCQLWNKPDTIHVSLFAQEYKFCAIWRKFVGHSFLSNRTTFLLNINIKNSEKLLEYFYKNFSISIFFWFNAWHETKFSNTFLCLNLFSDKRLKLPASYFTKQYQKCFLWWLNDLVV